MIVFHVHVHVLHRARRYMQDWRIVRGGDIVPVQSGLKILDIKLKIVGSGVSVLRPRTGWQPLVFLRKPFQVSMRVVSVQPCS